MYYAMLIEIFMNIYNTLFSKNSKTIFCSHLTWNVDIHSGILLFAFISPCYICIYLYVYNVVMYVQCVCQLPTIQLNSIV